MRNKQNGFCVQSKLCVVLYKHQINENVSNGSKDQASNYFTKKYTTMKPIKPEDLII